jgi:hypothetical protein
MNGRRIILRLAWRRTSTGSGEGVECCSRKDQADLPGAFLSDGVITDQHCVERGSRRGGVSHHAGRTIRYRQLGMQLRRDESSRPSCLARADHWLGSSSRDLTSLGNLERAGVPPSTAMAMVGHRTEAIYRRYAIVGEVMLRGETRRLRG